MTYVVGTQVRPSDPAAMRASISALVRPKLEAAGANYIAGLETVAGGTPGEFTIGSRWDSLDTGLGALKSFYEDPDVVSVLTASPVEVTGRVIGIVDGEQGNNSGTYAISIASTAATPDPSRNDALVADLYSHVSGHGVNGVRVLRLVAAAEMTGAYVTFMYTDSVDAAFEAMAAIYSNDAIMDHFQALGIQILARTVAITH